jgi:hypothetical protein
MLFVMCWWASFGTGSHSGQPSKVQYSFIRVSCSIEGEVVTGCETAVKSVWKQKEHSTKSH